MNFRQRRKALKKANFLDLTPLRVLGHELQDNGKVDILMPRFRNRTLAAMFQPAGKERFIRIRLDRFGSAAWLLLDGKHSVAAIADTLNSSFPEELQPPGETPTRLTQFLARLFRERYITFVEIESGAAPGSQ